CSTVHPPRRKRSRSSPLSAREHRTKISFLQNPRHLRAFVSLNLDLPVLHRAAGAARLLHRLGQALFFGKTDADKSLDHGDRLAPAPGGLADDVDPAAILPRRPGFRRLHRSRRGTFHARREPFARQAVERIVAEGLSSVRGNAFAFGIIHGWVQECRSVLRAGWSAKRFQAGEGLWAIPPSSSGASPAGPDVRG